MRYLVVLIGLFGLVCHGQAADLITVYQAALEKDPQLLKAIANQSAIEENKSVARGALLPQLNVEASLSEEHGQPPILHCALRPPHHSAGPGR